MNEEYTEKYFEARYAQVLNRPYDSSQEHSRGFHEEFALLNPQKHERALDIGCGLGNVAWALSTRVARCIGIDISEYAIQKAREFYHAGNLQYLVTDATKDEFQFGDGSFDIVVCSELYEHLDARDREALLRNIGKALTSDGRVLFIAPINEKTLLAIKQFIFTVLGKGKVQSDWTHKASFTLQDIVDELRKNGFMTMACRGTSSRGHVMNTVSRLIAPVPLVGNRLVSHVMLIARKHGSELSNE